MAGVWKKLLPQFRQRRLTLAWMILLASVTIALLADFIASDKPIVMRRNGETTWFANVRDLPDLRQHDIGTNRDGPGSCSYGFKQCRGSDHDHRRHELLQSVPGDVVARCCWSNGSGGVATSSLGTE